MEAQIIAVGSELLTPARIDTNSLYLTERLGRRGIDVVRKVVVGDDQRRIAREIRTARDNSQVVIVTGGLGPTLDDLSREGAAEALGREMHFEPKILGWIEERFKRYGRTPSENNKRQAYVIDGAEILENPNGTAPGLYFEDESGALMLLPGPPRELKPLFEVECEPRLDRLPSPYSYHTHSLRITGLGESDVDQRIGPIYEAEKRASTTILSKPGDIQLHVRGRADTVEEARSIAEAVAAKVTEELGSHVYVQEDVGLETVVGRLLVERGLRLSLAESCTGGLLAERMSRAPGSSEYLFGSFVTYDAAAKTAWLGVRRETIDEFGAVSEECAGEMAERARDAAGGPGRAVGVSITGFAGPGGGTDEAPVGTIFIGIADDAETRVVRRQFGGDRERNRSMASTTALDLLRRRLSAS